MFRTLPSMMTVAALILVPTGVWAGEAPRLRELRTQRVGDMTYFHVRFDLPADMRLPELARWSMTDAQRANLARLPRLVPQDSKTRLVYWRASQEYLARFLEVRAEPSLEALEFCGRLDGSGDARLLLLYPTEESAKADDKKSSREIRKRSWAEHTVMLDFGKATMVEVPETARPRRQDQPPSSADLEGQWALAQATCFAALEAQASDFGFYSFAREATARKYGVRAPGLQNRAWNTNRELLDRQLFETTTGTAAIAESLQLHRMLNANFRDDGRRTVDLAKVPGIDIAEHPWKKMMGDKQPAPEPLAKLVPHDNYYLHFKQIAKFIDFGELLDQWGTTLGRAYELQSRDYDLKQRYEKQLCLRSSWLGKTFGPAIVKSLAITGNDLYLREGSDVTVIFHVVNPQAFLGAVEPFLKEARQEFKTQLIESKDSYQDVAIESFVTPRRAVSLHRASFGEFVVYSNSPAGLRRVIDTHQGRLKPLADSLDFQYMRTIFRLDEERENGFAFLSDPFIRNLVGPASKIKEKRRLEAITSLYMETHGAMFTAWETGKFPDDRRRLLACSTLKAEELFVPEGKEVTWDQRHQVAVSDVYNTIHFATPLIELPIDKVTPTEEREYLRFRGEYLGLWRQYFDPIGMRFALDDKQVRVDTYILPLIQNSQYNELRRRTGNGTTKLDPAGFSPRTLLQFVTHIAPDAPERGSLTDVLRNMGNAKGIDWLGDWFLVRFDDSPVYAKLFQLALRRDMEIGLGDEAFLEASQLFFQMPVTVGVSVKNPLVFAGFLAGVKAQLNAVLPRELEWEPMEPAHKEVNIVRIRPRQNGEVAKFFRGGALPALYYALIDGGFYISLQEQPIKDLIDRSVARREGKEPEKKELVAINSALYLAPGAADQAKDLLRGYLEWESHRRALANEPIWYCLYRCGVVNDDMDAKTRRATAARLLAYVPVSPDEAAYRYERRTDEIVNTRHGSLRKPQFQAGVDPQSPLGQLLEQFRTVRADLRFREDGIHTVLTIERKR